MRALLILLAMLGGAQAQTFQRLVLDDSTIGPPKTGHAHLLYRPSVPGRHPAMIILSGCAGSGVHEEVWAERIMGWGYVALIVESMRPRGLTTVCDIGRNSPVPIPLRADDAFDAAAWMRTQDFIDPTRIGVIGFSHGGGGVLATNSLFSVRNHGGQPFRAAVAMYPSCNPNAQPKLATDTLILMGSEDEWTPADNCLALIEHTERNGHVLDFKVYQGAFHVFDIAGRRRTIPSGHVLGATDESVADSAERTKAFLQAHLAQ